MKVVAYFVLFAFSLVCLARPALAAQTVRCESRGHRHHCRVHDIEDKDVRLEHRIGHGHCNRGRSWGTDDRGIWVDDGCRAYFEVSERHEKRHHKDSGKTAAVVAGVALAAVLVAAAASTSQHKDDHDRDDDDDDDRAIPNFVTRSCSREAREWVESRPRGEYAHLDRIQKVRHHGDYWKMKAYYELVFESQTLTRLATCEVDDRHRVVRFEFD